MGTRRVHPEQIALDESGRVILSDVELEDAYSAALPLAGGTSLNTLSCINQANCQNSANMDSCLNASGACGGASNQKNCNVARK